MPELTPIQPEGLNSSSLARLMDYHDRQFVELAYQIILGRPADEAGLAHHSERLRLGDSRQEILYRIASSEEGRSRRTNLELFKSHIRWRRLERVPVLGAFLLLLVCVKRIRYFVREFRRLQNFAYGGIRAGSAEERR